MPTPELRKLKDRGGVYSSERERAVFAKTLWIKVMKILEEGRFHSWAIKKSFQVKPSLNCMTHFGLP